MNPAQLFALLGGAVVFFLIVFALAWFLEAAFLLWATKIVRIENSTYVKALGAALLSMIGSVAVSFLFGFPPVMGHVFSIVTGFLVSALVVMGIFSTTFGKALAASVISWLLTLLVLGLGGLLIFLLGLGISLSTT